MSTLEFNQMLSVHVPFLKSFALRFTKNVEDAEDLLQDTTVKALRYKNHFESGTNFRGWLYTIMKNIFINNYKRTKLRNTITDGSDNQYFLNYGKSGENTIASQLGEKEILGTIKRLPHEFKVPFNMFIDGYHYDEIADHMGIPIGTVKSRIFNARKKLMTELADFR
jgi:RNA polymerase sigma factor (sigma-70 family)